MGHQSRSEGVRFRLHAPSRDESHLSCVCKCTLSPHQLSVQDSTLSRSFESRRRDWHSVMLTQQFLFRYLGACKTQYDCTLGTSPRSSILFCFEGLFRLLHGRALHLSGDFEGAERILDRGLACGLERSIVLYICCDCSQWTMALVYKAHSHNLYVVSPI